MKLRILLLITTFISIALVKVSAKPLTDSIGVENQDGKKVIIHKVEAKETYYSIGRRYNVKPNLILQLNNNVSLHIGTVIKVPTEQPFVTATATAQPPAPIANNNGEVTQYKVSAGETLYAISRRFNVRVEDIIAQNNLRSNNLKPGQILQIKTAAQAAPAPAAQPPAPASDSIVAKRDSTRITDPADSITVERRLPANRYGLTERNEKGVATWMDDAGLDPNKKLVLHRTAPVGTVLRITNPMTNRTTFAKVVGSFTDNAMTKDVIIVLTKNAATALGALDKRFYVTISYGMPNNE